MSASEALLKDVWADILIIAGRVEMANVQGVLMYKGIEI